MLELLFERSKLAGEGFAEFANFPLKNSNLFALNQVFRLLLLLLLLLYHSLNLRLAQ